MPLSGQLCGTADGGVSHLSRFPAAFRLPAFASWSSISRWGIGPSLRSAYRGTDMNPGPNGVVTLRMHEMRPGRAPSIPRRRWCSHGRNGITDRHLPLSCGQSLYPGAATTSGAKRHEASLTVHCIHPSDLPLACSPRMERGPLGFSPELQTPPLLTAHVEVGTGT